MAKTSKISGKYRILQFKISGKYGNLPVKICGKYIL